VFVGQAQPTGLRAVEQGEALHRVHLPDVVGLLGALVVFLDQPPHPCWRQSSLVQPKLQGARGRDQLFGVALEQIEANAARPPARLLAAQRTTRLLHGEAVGAKRAAAAVEVGLQARIRRLLPPLLEQAADGACGDGQPQSDLWRREALLMKVEDALTRLRRCGSRHEGYLAGKKRRTASRHKQAGVAK
jgi:hypothetical protein